MVEFLEFFLEGVVDVVGPYSAAEGTGGLHLLGLFVLHPYLDTLDMEEVMAAGLA